MRKSIAVIGLSSFGFYLCKSLSDSGVQVMAIDNNEEKIDTVKRFVRKAVVADAKDRETLRNLQIQDFDAVVLSVGEEIDVSVLVTLHLRELGVKEIFAKASTEEHAKILNILGVTETIFPEKDIAKRFAHTLRRRSFLDYFSIGDDYSVLELAPPFTWLGKTISEIDIRNKHNVQIIIIKELVPENFVLLPTGDHVLKDSDVLVILGKDEDLAKLEKIK